MEYWVEENIRPLSRDNMDRVLLEHIKPIVFYLKGKGWLVTWHFLRESSNWRGSGNQPPLIQHIRFRVKAATDANLQSIRDFLRKVLDGLEHIGKINSHYRGNHGTPNQDYQGESNNFDESANSPQGWDAVQRWLQAGSEIELVFLKNRFRGIQLGQRFRLPDLLHFVGNQCNRDHDWTISGQFMIFQM